MTAATGAPPRARPDRAGRSRWRLRWYRVVVPFAGFALLAGATLLARQLEEPDLADPATLAPDGGGPDGSSRLAGLLTDRGVRIEYVTDVEQAMAAIRAGGPGVVFVPKPTLAGSALAGAAARAGEGHRVVLVAPNGLQLGVAGLPVVSGPERWAARVVEPACPVAEAQAAGRAAAQRRRYTAGPGEVCYRGGLVRTRVEGSEVFVVGAADPFRNRRIGEHGNAELAVGLLAAHDRVVWAGALPRPPGSALPGLARPERSELDRSGGSPFAGLLDGYPPGVLAGFGLAALLALLVALVRARRLGPPVAEPLPVLVPAAEAVAGRGRLYQRTNGRGVALAALRAGALGRLVPVLGLPAAPPPEPEAVVQAVVRRTGLADGQVRHTLYGPEPETDQDLAGTVAALDSLVRAAVRDRLPPTRRKEPP